MGWWQGENEMDVLGDGPADTLSAALQEIAQTQKRKPSLKDLLNALRAALQRAPASFLLEGDNSITSLTATLNNGSTVFTNSDPLPPDALIRVIFQALEDIVVEYEDMEEHRKPRLSEILDTVAFILGPDDQNFVESPGRSGVRAVTADFKKEVGQK